MTALNRKFSTLAIISTSWTLSFHSPTGRLQPLFLKNHSTCIFISQCAHHTLPVFSLVSSMVVSSRSKLSVPTLMIVTSTQKSSVDHSWHEVTALLLSLQSSKMPSLKHRPMLAPFHRNTTKTMKLLSSSTSSTMCKIHHLGQSRRCGEEPPNQTPLPSIPNHAGHPTSINHSSLLSAGISILVSFSHIVKLILALATPSCPIGLQMNSGPEEEEEKKKKKNEEEHDYHLATLLPFCTSFLDPIFSCFVFVNLHVFYVHHVHYLLLYYFGCA